MLIKPVFYKGCILKNHCLLFLFFSFLFLQPLSVNAEEEYIQAPAAIQISSQVSAGKLSLPEIIDVARNNQIKVVVLAERDFMNWEYGLWPLRRIIKKTESSASMFTYGMSRYFKELDALKEKNKDLVIISGVESAPFYYWRGNFLSDKFTIADWHKHMLVFGMTPKGYRYLPAVSNKTAIWVPRNLKQVLSFWPILLVLAGVRLFRKRKFSYTDAKGKQLGPYSLAARIMGAFFIGAGFLILFNNFPFSVSEFDQYHGNLGALPYQQLIDYVNEKKGLIFWAHPEAENLDKIGRVHIETKEHTRNLLETHDYTGFCIFFEGYKKVGVPGGIWDELLNQYCRGERQHPLWAIGGLSFDFNGDLNDYIRDLRTVLLVPALTETDALIAIKSGRMYVVRGRDSAQFVLDKFSVSDNSGSVKKTFGEELAITQNPKIEITGHLLSGQEKAFSIKLIRNGEIIKNFAAVSPFNVSFEDDLPQKSGKFYYRIEIISEGVIAVTNPVFVTKK